MAYKLPKLPYDYDALKPHIDEKTMRIHHDLHHGGYVKKLNKAFEGKEKFLKMDINELMAKLDKVPKNVRVPVRKNGGGHSNHSLFWTIMSPEGKREPKGHLKDAIKSTFGSFEDFKEKFANEALGIFGSGWAWLTVHDKKLLRLSSTPNQDTPLMKGHTPILGLDVWEHAYYLKYQNKRAEYVNAWWNVVSWEKVEKLFHKALK